MGHACPTVVLTRSCDDNALLRERLEALGTAVIELPTAAIVDLPPQPEVATCLSLCAQAQVVAFTSRHGVDAWCRQLGAPSLLDAVQRGASVAAVGKGTASALERWGIPVGIQASDPMTGAHLAQSIGDHLMRLSDHQTSAGMPARTLAVQGRQARPELLQGLRDRGLPVDTAVVYENVTPPPPTPALAVACAQADAVYLAAPSAADRVLAWVPQLREVPLVVIGPTTATELLERHGLTAAAVAASATIDAAVQALQQVLASRTPFLDPSDRSPA
ncbi:MAG: uroporphyrinogen-III synthase [Myxococcota bacterium]|jgi:uroporphyrinogen III methyltransferase/synthase